MRTRGAGPDLIDGVNRIILTLGIWLFSLVLLFVVLIVVFYGTISDLPDDMMHWVALAGAVAVVLSLVVAAVVWRSLGRRPWPGPRALT